MALWGKVYFWAGKQQWGKHRGGGRGGREQLSEWAWGVGCVWGGGSRGGGGGGGGGYERERVTEYASEWERDGGRVSTSCPELYVGNNFWHGPIRRKSLHSSPSLCCSQGMFKIGRRQGGNANITFVDLYPWLLGHWPSSVKCRNGSLPWKVHLNRA